MKLFVLCTQLFLPVNLVIVNYFIMFSGPGSQYSPDCTGMYMDGQHMMRAAGAFSDIWILWRIRLVLTLLILKQLQTSV